MDSEKAVLLKRQRKKKLVTKTHRICVVHNNNLKKEKTICAFSDITWNKLTDCKAFHLKSENTLANIAKICENLPDILDETFHGYHKSCYATFTNLTQRERKRKVESQQDGCSRAKRAYHGSSALFDKDTCIFCKKKNGSGIRKNKKVL